MKSAGLPSIPGATSADTKLNQTTSPRDPTNGDQKSGDGSKHSSAPSAWQAVFMALLQIPPPRGTVTANRKTSATAASAVSTDATPSDELSLSAKSKTSASQDLPGLTPATGTSFTSAGESATNVAQSPNPTAVQSGHQTSSSPSQSFPTNVPAVPGQSNSPYATNAASSQASLLFEDGAKSAQPISKLSSVRSREDRANALNSTTSPVHEDQIPRTEDGGHLPIVPSKIADAVTAISPKSHGFATGGDNSKKQASANVPDATHLGASPTNASAFSLTVGTVRFTPGSPDAIPNLMNNLPFSTIHQALAQGALANPGMVFVLHLNPPELGQIALKITAGADQRVHLHFKVDDLAVKQVLSAGWNHLQSSLIAHGLAPDGLTVDLNSTTTAGSFFGQTGGDRPTPHGGQATGLSIVASTPTQEELANEPSLSRHLVDYIL